VRILFSLYDSIKVVLEKMKILEKKVDQEVSVQENTYHEIGYFHFKPTKKEYTENEERKHEQSSCWK
jgi:hypothetical protein